MVHVLTETRVQVTNELISTPKLQKLGKAVYLTASLFNHSCDPNLIMRFVYYTCITLIRISIYSAILTLVQLLVRPHNIIKVIITTINYYSYCNSE